MIAKNGIDYEAMGFVVYGECPEYKGYYRRRNMSKEKNISFTPSYKLWSSLKNYAKLCEEWKEYSNFEKWYDENYYQIDNDLMCLDKDILHKGNKIYNPNDCVFVNRIINNLFTKSNNIRGELPIGVKKSSNGKYNSCV